MNNEQDASCPYCGEEFADENEKGVHISENHVDEGSEIPKPKRKRHRNNNLVDKYRDNTDGK